MGRLFYWYPIVVSALGIGIHFFGTLRLFQREVPQANHIIMLIIDMLVVIGLLKRTTWGYWFAVLLYIQQSTMQPYWAYQAYMQGKDFGLFQVMITSPAVIAALFVLVFNKRLFIKKSQHDQRY
jgi:uncharacterized membrane protein